jgi:hypothetical protein
MIKSRNGFANRKRFSPKEEKRIKRSIRDVLIDWRSGSSSRLSKLSNERRKMRRL